VLLCLQGDRSTGIDTASQVCSRGLRLKVGVDVGLVMDSVHAATGRMAYCGKAMNRAARIASAAASGQVTAVLAGLRCAKSDQHARCCAGADLCRMLGIGFAVPGAPLGRNRGDLNWTAHDEGAREAPRALCMLLCSYQL
jgi:class 3 adenylate cyclase